MSSATSSAISRWRLFALRRSPRGDTHPGRVLKRRRPRTPSSAGGPSRPLDTKRNVRYATTAAAGHLRPLHTGNRGGPDETTVVPSATGTCVDGRQNFRGVARRLVDEGKRVCRTPKIENITNDITVQLSKKKIKNTTSDIANRYGETELLQCCGRPPLLVARIPIREYRRTAVVPDTNARNVPVRYLYVDDA